MPTRTPTPWPTTTPLPPGISGRVLLNGQPVEQGLLLALEDRSYNQIAETLVLAGGWYYFEDVPSSVEGYFVTFSWQQNQSYGLDEVIAWGWIGPVAYAGQSALNMPDLDIALTGLEHIQPEPDTSHSSASISQESPLVFEWAWHPAATRFWVDILAGDSLERLWRSPLVQTTSTEFDGQLDDGDRIQPGSYWWAVGGRSTRQGYQLTVYGHLAGLRFTR